MIFDFAKIEEIIGYKFKDKELLKGAFVHSSYANEHRVYRSNERLEFLGDSVVSIIVTDYIFNRFRNNEGDLSKIRASLVSEKSFSAIFELMGLDKFILTGAGLKNTKPTRAMMADAFEALVACIYLDGGLEKARKFVLDKLSEALVDIKESGVPDSNKSILQERFKTSKVTYMVVSKGEGQEKFYTAKALIDGEVCGVGEAQKKRDAEEIAAKNALINTKKV